MINDYRKQGSLFVLTALFEYGNGQVSENLLNSMLDMRMLFEVENAGLAARNRSEVQMDQFYEILDQERQADPENPTQMADLDFAFHHLVSIASDNLVYSLLLNSLRQFYISLTQKFFSNGSVIPWVLEHHGKLVGAIGDQQPETARQYMEKIVLHGEKNLRITLEK